MAGFPPPFWFVRFASLQFCMLICMLPVLPMLICVDVPAPAPWIIVCTFPPGTITVLLYAGPAVWRLSPFPVGGGTASGPSHWN